MKPAHRLFIKMFIATLACSLCCVLLLVSAAALALAPDAIMGGSTLGFVCGVAIFMLAIAVIVSFAFSRWLYTPIQSIIAEKTELESQSWRYGKIVEQQFLTRLTMQPISDEAFLQSCKQYGISLRTPLQVCLVRMCDSDTSAYGGQAEEQAMLYAICNVVKEVMHPYANISAVSMQEKHTATFFISGRDGLIEQSAFEQACYTVQHALKISVFMTFNEKPCPAVELTAIFQTLSLAALCRIFNTSNRCLRAEDVQATWLPPDQILSRTEQLMERCIGIGHRLITEADYDSAADYIALLRGSETHIQLYRATYDAVCASWMHELLVLKSVSSKKTIAQFVLPSLELEECNNIASIEQFIQHVCGELQELAQDLHQPQYVAYLEQVRSIVEERYADPSFGVQELADSIGLSAPYLSKLYKNATKQNITDLISQRRMGEAQELLCRTDLPIGQIAKNCGYLNANYFHRVFKNTFLQTPNQYRVKGRNEVNHE